MANNLKQAPDIGKRLRSYVKEHRIFQSAELEQENADLTLQLNLLKEIMGKKWAQVQFSPTSRLTGDGCSVTDYWLPITKG